MVKRDIHAPLVFVHTMFQLWNHFINTGALGQHANGRYGLPVLQTWPTSFLSTMSCAPEASAAVHSEWPVIRVQLSICHCDEAITRSSIWKDPSPEGSVDMGVIFDKGVRERQRTVDD